MSSTSSSPSKDPWERDDDKKKNQIDSYPLKPLRASKIRKERLQRERDLKEKYVQGNELIELREFVIRKRMFLKNALHDRNEKRAEELQGKIKAARSRDAEYVYGEALKAIKEAERDGRTDDALEFKRVAMEVRSCMPQFNLEGLWVGKYGSHGYEMINVTYTGNTLVAYKVTGDKNVPKDEITFTADLTPNVEDFLTPIELSHNAAKQWGVERLIRFPGQGQVASEGYKNKQWIEGQLLLVGEYFSFAWVPLGHQIFFGRPSPELTIKMLKESENMPSRIWDEDEEVARMRRSAMKCLEETISLEEDEKIDSLAYLGEAYAECDVDDCFQ